MITIERDHEICMAHRIYGHLGRCANLHGHNYKIKFILEASELDNLGMALDFGDVKNLLCEWLENNWDHKTMLYKKDPWSMVLPKLDPEVIVVNFNPTAENMAQYLLETICPSLFMNMSGVFVRSVEVQETSKCRAIADNLGVRKC